MTKISRLWPLTVTVLALMLLVSGLPGLQFQPARPFPLWIFTGGQPPDSATGQPVDLANIPWMGLLLFLVGLAFALILILWVIVFILRPQARKGMFIRLVSYIILLLAVLALTNAFKELDPAPQATNIQPAQAVPATPGPEETQKPTPPVYISSPPRWLTLSITLVIVALALGGGWLLWQRRPGPTQPVPAQQLARQARQALAELHSGQELKDTVMRCYLQMTQVLSQQAGMERPQAMTPREFEAELSQAGLDDEHIRRLTRLFENVRYGAETATPRQEQEAIACLSAIADGAA